MNKQALTEALVDYNLRDVTPVAVPHLNPIIAAARLVERLLPGECPRCQGTGQHSDPGMGGPKYYDLACRECREPGPQKRGTGQVWDEGIVEAVAHVLFAVDQVPQNPPSWDDLSAAQQAWYRRSTVAVLSAIAELLAEAGSQ